MMKNILCVCYGGGHVRSLLPVIKKLRYFQNVNLTVLALTTAAKVLEEEGIKYVTYSNFVSLVDKEYELLGKSLVDKNCKVSKIPIGESVAYYGINYLDLIEQYGRESAEQIFKKRVRQSFNPINFMKKLLAYLRVDLLIATNSPRSERAAFYAARELQIKRICLVDFFALQEMKWISEDGFATKICVLNESIKNSFMEAGCTMNQLVITGNPAFDSLFDSLVIERGRSLRFERNGIDDVVDILYASQPEPVTHPFNGEVGNPNLPREIESELRAFVEMNSGFRLIIRYHPSENVEFVPQKNVSLSPMEDSLHELLHSVDLVVVMSSTVGLEAHLIGKKVLSIDNSIFTPDAPYSKMGISIGVRETNDISEVIKVISDTQKENERSLSVLNATNNVLSVIETELID